MQFYVLEVYSCSYQFNSLEKYTKKKKKKRKMCFAVCCGDWELGLWSQTAWVGPGSEAYQFCDLEEAHLFPHL